MATPITWRNVDAPDNRGVSAMLGGAQDGINSGLGQLANILKQRESVNEANWNQQKANNTQAFLDAVGKPTTPEEFAALQKSGVLEQMRQGFGSQVDLAATRAAEEARLSTLQQRQNTNNDFLDRTLARAQLPIQEKIKTAYINGDIAGGDALVAANPGLVHPDEIAKLRVSSQDDATRRTQEALLRPLAYQNQVDTAKLTGLQIKAQEQGIADTAKDRALTDTAAAIAASHQQNVQEIAQKQGKLAMSMGLPVTDKGLPDFKIIDGDERMTMRFKDAMIKNNLQMPSDTEALAGSLRTLVKSGMSSIDAAKLSAKVSPLMNTAPEDQLVGQDKVRFDNAKATIASKYAEAQKTNSLFVSNTNVTDKIPELRKALRDSGVDNEGIRIVQDEVIQSLKDNPDKVLHIPAIVAAAGSSESWNPFMLVGRTFRTHFNNSLKDLTDTDAYRKQVEQFRQWENGSSGITERARQSILGAVGKDNR